MWRGKGMGRGNEVCFLVDLSFGFAKQEMLVAGLISYGEYK